MTGISSTVTVALALNPPPTKLSARPVAGRERRRLVQEEELGVVAGPHDPAPAPLELQDADDPAGDGPGAPDALVGLEHELEDIQLRVRGVLRTFRGGARGREVGGQHGGAS